MEAAMEGGVGDGSYAKNSSFQGSAFSLVFPAVKNVIASLKPGHERFSTLRVADLGCSSGPNTIHAIDKVVSAFKEKFELDDHQPDFQAFFSDVKANDFNTLFQELGNEVRDYFAAGVPGSFFEKLFPSSSIHFAMTNVALHWMSKLPEGMVNPGLVSPNRANPDVAKAYQQQAHKDLLKFLRFRADELVPGGILCILMNGRRREDPSKQTDDDGLDLVDWACTSLERSWGQLIQEGLMDQETLDTFNMPCFHRSKNDITKGIEEAGDFKVLHLELVDTRMPGYGELKQGPGGDDLTREKHARKEAMVVRSASGPIVEKHLKNEFLTDALYKRLELLILKQEPVPSRHLLMYSVILQRL